MWKRILNTEYFLLDSDYSEVIVTNFVSLWFLQFSDDSFTACLQESNFGLTMREKEMIEKGKSLLNNPHDLKTVKENKDGSTLVLTLIKSFGYPFKLQLKLTEGSKELFFQRITLPLLRTVEDLRGSEAELKRLLVKKDQEIEEYKCEGGEIALRHLKTVPFNEEAHTIKHTLFLENFGADDIPDCLLKKTIDVPEEQVKPEPSLTNGGLKAEPKTEIKVEDHSVGAPAHAPLKNELSSQPIQTSLKAETLSQQSTASGVSPSKRQRKKLNL